MNSRDPPDPSDAFEGQHQKGEWIKKRDEEHEAPRPPTTKANDHGHQPCKKVEAIDLTQQKIIIREHLWRKRKWIRHGVFLWSAQVEKIHSHYTVLRFHGIFKIDQP